MALPRPAGKIPVTLLIFMALSHGAVSSLWHPYPRGTEAVLRTRAGLPFDQPYTLEGGRLALDALGFSFSHDQNNTYFADQVVERLTLGRLDLRIGVVSGLEVQIHVPDFNIVNRWMGGAYSQSVGVGDTSVSLKIGRPLEEGDDVRLAMAGIATYRTFPLSPSNGRAGQGLDFALPFEINLPSVYRFTAVPQLFLENRKSDQWTPVGQLGLLFSGVIRNRIRFNIGMALKVDSSMPERFTLDADVGLAWGIGSDWVLWGGSRFGLTLTADDVAPYFGVSWRL